MQQVLERVRLTEADVTITKAIFPATRMPGRIREMVTFVHGPISRTYACSANGAWLDLLASDIAREAVRRARMPAAAQDGGTRASQPLVAAGLRTPPAAQEPYPAVAPSATRLLYGAAIRRDDREVLEAIQALPEPQDQSSCLFRAVILNEEGHQYREVDLYGMLESVSLTASLNGLGFTLDAAKREGRSRRYDWSFSKEGQAGLRTPGSAK